MLDKKVRSEKPGGRGGVDDSEGVENERKGPTSKGGLEALKYTKRRRRRDDDVGEEVEEERWRPSRKEEEGSRWAKKSSAGVLERR